MDFLFPRYCIICGKRLEIDEEALCLTCNIDLPRLGWFGDPYENPLAKYFYGKAELEKAASFMKFIPKSGPARLIYGKYAKKPRLCYYDGRLLAFEAEGTNFFDDIDLIVPMPSSTNHELKRGFNQCLYIAKGISSVTGIPVNSTSVIRIRSSVSQASLTSQSRTENVENAFFVLDAKSLDGKHILIVEDVITTGSTVCSCVNEIHKHANVKISILSFCITIRQNGVLVI